MFHKVLIANRGEIACRVIRTCRKLGIKTAAVYSDADVDAPHTKLADESHRVGPANAPESYMNIDKVVATAKACGAEAIHPGYGFLSENPRFSEAVSAAGLVFIGPPPAATRALGTKIGARKLVEKDGVSTVPWTVVPADDPLKAEEASLKFGYPVVVKPSAGGGGIGTTVVRSPAELPEAMERATVLAKRFFDQPTIHIEKCIEFAKHIELQVMLDQHGTAITFPERECSIQRRYQKVIEESPSMAISHVLRARLADAALRVMRAGGYYNVGTVENLVDARNNYYFLEVNSRIQVEHPVTEMVTGLDIVELQLQVASGRKLNVPREKLQPHGHSIEARVYAEDPETLFPSGGLITAYREPVGEGVRVDSGVAQGYEVTSFYDPLMAKLIVWAPTRDKAIEKMHAALDDYVIEGFPTNIPLVKRILSHPPFLNGEYHTNTLNNDFMAPVTPPPGTQALNDWWRYGR
ncbi:MAG: ATP-grasp domain-containing protein [Dehalococcoidia bacterium]|nr:ATP-grasp domain-containing protein [Dehalococcoidia bacterium]MSQ34365.1 ATP-grasp domain-containing protein [Dehalococcoidia bacterium]